MGFLQKLASIFSLRQKPAERYYEFQVRCNRCAEILSGRADLHNELSVDYGEHGKGENYYVRKVLMGEGHCFQRIEVELYFDKDRRLVNKEISGGTFVED